MNCRPYLVVFLCLSPVSHAQGITVTGSVDCGQWHEARRADRAGYLEHYLLGLLNGMSMGSSKDFWKAKGVSVSREAVYLWMDNFCRTNPLSDVIEGTSKLFVERAGPITPLSNDKRAK